MRRTKHAALGALAVVALCAGWIFFQPDEALTPALRDTFAPRNASQATIGLLGLEAPAGTDFMEHGRLALAEASRTGGYALDVETELSYGKPRLEAKHWDSLECWLYVPGEKIPEEVSRNCASPDQLQAILDENAELLQRYRTIQKLPVAADGEGFRGTTTINLGKLIVADIANDLRLGQAERAYRKWADNHSFQTRMAGYAGGWVLSAINMVNEGLSFTGLELLVAKVPQLMQLHRQELLEILKPRDEVGKRVMENLRGEIRSFEQIRAELPIQRFVRVNRLRNRYAAYANDIADAAAANPTTLPAAIAAVNSRHDTWRVGDIFDPITASAWRLLMSGQVKRAELIDAMFRKEAQRRLHAIRIMRVTANALDANIEADMKAAPRELRNPFDGSPAQWDASTRTLYFNAAGRGRVEIVM